MYVQHKLHIDATGYWLQTRVAISYLQLKAVIFT